LSSKLSVSVMIRFIPLQKDVRKLDNYRHCAGVGQLQDCMN
jgi:hypothetical protein